MHAARRWIRNLPWRRVGALAWLLVVVLRAASRAQNQRLSALTDRQLRDIGLSRCDAAGPHERSPSPELDAYRLLRGRG